MSFRSAYGHNLREAINIYGQGMKNGSQLKLAQTGGSSGRSSLPVCRILHDFESSKAGFWF
jgi:NADH:ubiquinone oxidoreductase subunit F (NADH-binding)